MSAHGHSSRNGRRAALLLTKRKSIVLDNDAISL